MENEMDTRVLRDNFIQSHFRLSRLTAPSIWECAKRDANFDEHVATSSHQASCPSKYI